MSLLEFMEIRWKFDGEVSGFEYSSVDDVIKAYYVHDHVKVATIIQLAVDKMQDHHTAAKKFIIQSDNASCFDSQELIPLIFNMNTRRGDDLFCVEHIDIHRSTDRKNVIGYSLFISE